MADGVDVLTKVKLAELPGANAVPVLFAHMIELASRVLAQPDEFPALLGSDGKLFPLCVQPYQRLFKLVVPVFSSVIV